MTTVLLRHGRALGGAALPDLLLRDGLVQPADTTRPADVEVVDLDGRWVVPGLWDQHVHLSQWALHARRLDLGDATSAAEAASRLRDAVTTRTGDDPVLAHGLRPAVWPDEPTAALLEEATGGVPVVATCFDLHSAWANAAALSRYGLDALDPGLVREEACFELQRRMADVPDATLDAWVADAARAAAARGVVGVVDMEMAWNLDPWRRRMAAGFDHLRVRASTYPQWLSRAVAEGVRTGDVDPASPLLEVGPLKVITDGSLGTRTACCVDPYPDGTHGALNVTPDDLLHLMADAHAGGLACAVHAIGDEANRLALDAFAATGATGRVEHAQLLRDEDVARFAVLGVAASVQPQHLAEDAPAAPRHWPGREHRMFRLRALLDAGATVVLGSDAPVVPLDPWHQVQMAVERALPGQPPFGEDQALTVAEALACSTDGRGTIPAARMPADLAVLDADPLAPRGQALRDLPVAATLVAGRFTHRTL